MTLAAHGRQPSRGLAQATGTVAVRQRLRQSPQVQVAWVGSSGG